VKAFTFIVFFLLQSLTSTQQTHEDRPYTQTQPSMAPIHDASKTGGLADVKRLVEEEGVNPETPNPSNRNAAPLLYGSWYGRDHVVTYLLETCGVYVDQVNDNNFTALHFASQENHTGCVRVLLQYGADPNIADTSVGDSPLMLAAYEGHIAAMTLLLEDGRCNLEAKRTDTGASAIILAAVRKKWDCVESLLSYNASPVATTNNGPSLHDFATHRQAPPQTLQLIETAIFEQHRPRLLHRARRINEARHNPATDGPAFLRQRADNNLPLPRVELSSALPTAADEDEQTVQRAVVRYVVGMKEDGSVGGGMLKEHLVELMDMMLPVWDTERGEEEEEEET
jgi:ankyrin repeat protein